MRKNLADLRGQLVAWKGWETNSRYNNTWACISKPTVTVSYTHLTLPTSDLV